MLQYWLPFFGNEDCGFIQAGSTLAHIVYCGDDQVVSGEDSIVQSVKGSWLGDLYLSTSEHTHNSLA